MPGHSMLNMEQSMTPVTYQKFSIKPPARKLWQKEIVTPDCYTEVEPRRTNMDVEKWDVIDSPQYVDFCNLMDPKDSFFDRQMVVSTPLISAAAKSSTPNLEDDMMSSFNNMSISQVRHEPPIDEYNNFCDNDRKEDAEEYVVHNVNYEQKKESEQREHPKIESLQSNEIAPSIIGSQKNNKSAKKTERVNKILAEEKKMYVFKANPVPKYCKAFTLPTMKYENGDKCDKPNNSEKLVRKKAEVWKKKPFMPSLGTRPLTRPKTPPLSTLHRAKERKRFDDALREKEKQKEQMRQMEELARKKAEEREIAELRRKIVHKAQPIRKYKAVVPKMEKRPLVEPISPLTHKRRRRDYT